MLKFTQESGERPIAGSISRAASTSGTVLDTLEQVPPEHSPNAIQGGVISNLSKRARAKFVTNLVARPLAQLRSPLQKAYKLSTTCAGELTEVPGKITSLYCGCRWCIVCSRIRTAKLINGYMPAIEQMGEKWFLTLSRPNVPGAQLEDEIQHYLRDASLIQRHLREKRKLQFSSLRKIECTYNEQVKTYHPHFHYIFDSWEAANATLQEWLARNPTAKLNKGNLLKKADDKAVLELFKYFTKVVSKTKSKAANGTESAEYRIHLEALDRMFVAMRRVRTFQPCGVVKFVSEEIEPEQALESGRAQINHWKWLKYDWMNVDTAAVLTGYVPSASIQDIERHIIYPEGVSVAPGADLTPYYVDKETGEVLGNEHARECRNSMRYAKIYPSTEGAQAASRRKPCNLVSVDWESQREEVEHQAPAPAPVSPTGPKTAPSLPFSAQPGTARRAPGPGGRIEARKPVGVGHSPTPRKTPIPTQNFSLNLFS